ncbi:glycosyltransferase family 4 protein [Micromonospora sp. NBC_00389]|uniref:glycosyltransferase family 4 protein n=1 Tax=Micromonospora sp. NBC_00389 TaxID=2903586 RepID=UPI002E20077D
MKILVAGGVFRHSAEELAKREPAPEVVLVDGLRRRGIEVRACRLEDRGTVALARESDIVHVHHLSKAAVLAALSPLARPFVFTAHRFALPPTPLQRRAQRMVMSRATAVVCLSQVEAEQTTSRYRLPRSRVEVIPNGIGISSDVCRPRRLAPDGQIILLFVGQLIAMKQIHRVIEALPDLPRQVVLRLVYHNDELECRLRERARALGLLDRVTFVGQRSGPELVEEYRRAHLLVLPSELGYECLPSVVTEGLLTGLPVVASEVGGVPDQVRDAGVLVSPSSSVSLAPAITTVLQAYEHFANRALARARTAANDYSVDHMIDRHLDLYQRLMQKGEM